MQQRPNQRNNSARAVPVRSAARRRVLARGVFVLAFVFACAPFAHASTTNGTIDSSYKYAWGNVAGYVNFAPQYGNISVTDSTVTGYAWSANDGWINLSPSGSGVTNDSNGTLGGFAWDSSQGWISFSGVSINSSGKFTGQATGANGYILNFDCSSCNVQTDWRPASSRTSGSHSSSGGSISPILSSNDAPTSPTPAPNTAPTSPANTHGTQSGNSTQTASSTTHPTPTSGISSHNATSNHIATTTKSISSKIASFFHAAIIPVSIILLLVIAFFVFRFFL